MLEVKCRNCAGLDWVCENHKDTPWAGLSGEVECCGGAGAPCPVCQPEMANAGLLDECREAAERKVVEWLRSGAGLNTQSLDRSSKVLFFRGLNSYADAIERGEHRL